MKEKSLTCLSCGAVKTEENTHYRNSDGTRGLRPVCKHCAYRRSLSTEKLLENLAFHQSAITKIENELERRGE